MTGLLVFVPDMTHRAAMAIFICVLSVASLNYFKPHLSWVVFFVEQISFMLSTFKYLAVILLDTRAPSAIISDKFLLVSETLNGNRGLISAPLEAVLDSGISDLNAALASNDFDAALTIVDGLIVALENASGSEIADVWRSSNDLVNAKGMLISRLQTLRYSLRII